MVDQPVKTAAQLAEENRLAELAQKEKADKDARDKAQKAQDDGGIFGGLFKMISDLLQAIFGAFSDTKSEYSEIDQKDAAPPKIMTQTAPQRAAAFLQSFDNTKLTALTTKYKGMQLANISPLGTDGIPTSTLGERHITGGSRDHKGLDMVPVGGYKPGTVVHNTMPGIVVRSETQYDKHGKVAGFGNWVEVACIDGTRRRYAHLKELGVPVGTVLDQGEQIGFMGNTGASVGHNGGYHLHYEWRDKDGNLLEPEINDVRYAKNDKSKLSGKIVAADPAVYEGKVIALANHTTAPAFSPSNEAPSSSQSFAGAKPKKAVTKLG